MKLNFVIVLIVLTIGLFTSCINEFLEILPKDKQTEATAFVSYDNFYTYSLGFYNELQDARSYTTRDYTDGPWMTNNTSTNFNAYAYQKATETTKNGEWSFSYIRRVNIMLENIEKSEMSEEDKNHWRGIGLFFRAYKYFKLLSLYGDIPFIEHTITEDSEEMMMGRTSRDEVATNILRDLEYAENNIKSTGDGPNTINPNVVRFLISRFGLFEGTWRKYHNLEGSSKYLRASVLASEKLIEEFPNIHENYEELFTQYDLENFAGVVLYLKYAENVMYSNRMRDLSGASGQSVELTKQTVDLYLCADGRPISTSEVYDGDKTPFDEFRNRDYRLLFTVTPPCRVYKPGAATSIEWRFLNTNDVITIGGNPPHKITKVDSVLFREYIDLLAKINPAQDKQLPATAWNNTLVTDYLPRMRVFSQGVNPFSSRFGYWFWKHYNKNPPYQAQNYQSYPLFRMGEILLNEAEAKWELGEFTQEIADKTINKLRTRVNVANMVVADIDQSFDLDRDLDVDPVLWEIRRERIVELMAEGHSFNDVRRWKKGPYYYNRRWKGMWLNTADFNNTVQIEGYNSVEDSANKEGYVLYLDEPKGWLDKYYLMPIPLKELVLNPNLTQNPGWKDE